MTRLLLLVTSTSLDRYLLHPDRYRLEIDDTGIHERYVMGCKTIRWSEIESIEMQEVEGHPGVVYRLKQKSGMRFWTFGRFDDYHLNQYAITEQELLRVLNEHRERFTPPPDAQR